MELPEFSLQLIQGFLICLARVGAMVGSIPIFSGGQVPPQLRVGFAFLFSLLAFPVVESFLPTQNLHLLEIVFLLIQETMLGLMVGFLGQLVFLIAEFAGGVVGYQMGFAAANVFDPTTQRQIPLVSQFQSIFAILLFLALNVHHLFLEAIFASFEMLPPGSLNLSGGAIPLLMEVANHSFVLSIRMIAPILVILILVKLVLGVMSRVFPQLNVFFLSFPINIGISFIVMGITFGLVAQLLTEEFNLLSDRFLQIFNLL